VTTETKIAPLIPQDVDALRKADVVVFRHYKGVATIEASLRGRLDPRVYTASEQRLFPEVDSWERKRTIPVDGLITYYDNDETCSRRTAGPEGHAVSVLGSANYTRTWTTIANLLKPGDVLSLHFNGDRYANKYSRDAGVHIDGLNLDVQRGKTEMSFVIDVSVCPANSARMVKPHGGF
jgi:hypothetical protein